jgi:hypothetical protein
VNLAVECKDCKLLGVKTALAVKYVGADDGETIRHLPAPPRFSVFTLTCEACGNTNEYSPSEMRSLSAEKPPPPDFPNLF